MSTCRSLNARGISHDDVPSLENDARRFVCRIFFDSDGTGDRLTWQDLCFGKESRSGAVGSFGGVGDDGSHCESSG